MALLEFHTALEVGRPHILYVDPEQVAAVLPIDPDSNFSANNATIVLKYSNREIPVTESLYAVAQAIKEALK
jgi:hypothetical protein